MTVYVVEVQDEKWSICAPTVVGPFLDDEEASRFISQMQMGEPPLEGGYNEVHIVSEATSQHPYEYAADHEVEWTP